MWCPCRFNQAAMPVSSVVTTVQPWARPSTRGSPTCSRHPRVGCNGRTTTDAPELLVHNIARRIDEERHPIVPAASERACSSKAPRPTTTSRASGRSARTVGHAAATASKPFRAERSPRNKSRRPRSPPRGGRSRPSAGPVPSSSSYVPPVARRRNGRRLEPCRSRIRLGRSVSTRGGPGARPAFAEPRLAAGAREIAESVRCRWHR